MASTPVPQQINLYNPALMPRVERFSARQISAWALLLALALGLVAWWAIDQTRGLRREIAQETARVTAPAVSELTQVQRQIDALEQTLRERQAFLDTRRTALDALKRGMAGPDAGPSGVMRKLAETIPASAWLVEMRAAGSRLDIKGKALEPAAVEAYVERLRSSELVARQPPPSVRLERVDAAPGPAARLPQVYAFEISAVLAAPFAEEGLAR